MKYRIAFNRMALRAKLSQGDARWGEFNDSFDNLTFDTTIIADHIYRGYAFTTWMGGRRSIENFICGQHIAVDLDTGDERSTLAALSAHLFVRMYGGILYTTPSHTLEAPRARVLFFLDQTITDPHGYQEAAKFVIAQFDGADVACSDASRFFYGSYGCELAIPDNVLPLLELRHLFVKWKQAQPRHERNTNTERTTGDGAGQFERLVGEMAMAREGNRNNTLNRVAFIVGKIVAEGKINARDAESRLLSAATQTGLPEREAAKTIARAIEQGKVN
jgi:hypothetical protein